MTQINRLEALRAKNADRGSVVEVAYWTLREAIRDGNVLPGERLMEVPLAEALEMSRTPVREALRRLEAEQLIDNVPRRGLIVPEITLEDLIEIFTIREYLEGLCARLATEQMLKAEMSLLEQIVLKTEQVMETGDTSVLADMSRTFHQRIRQGARSARLPKLISLLYDAHRSTGLHELTGERRRRAVAEHRHIFDAMQSGDAQEAETRMRQHIRSALNTQIEGIELK